MKILRLHLAPSAVGALLTLVCVPDPVLAHAGRAIEPHDLWGAWTFAPGVLIALVASTVLYLRGMQRFLARAARATARASRHGRWFAAGLTALAVALVSPVDAVSESLFSVHMIQHLLLVAVAAPLLVLGEPLFYMLWTVSPERRHRVALAWRRSARMRAAWTLLTRPVVAWVLHIAILWMWHTPRMYDSAVRSPTLHVIEHTAFLGSALLFWWVALDRRHLRLGSATLYFFAAALQCTLLGALLTLARTPWYFSHYATTQAWSLTPLQDQQLAGLTMWIPGGFAYLLALIPRFVAALRERTERPRWPVLAQ